MRRIVSWVGHQIRELIVHLKRWSQPGRNPRVVFLPWGVPEGDSTELRVFNVAQTLRKRGWRCVVIPAQLELYQRQRIIRFEKPDVIFIQKSRHPANRPRFYSGYPVIYDIDDADFLDDRATESVAECCRESKAVIAGSDFVAKWCGQFNPNVHVVWTGTPVPPSRPPVRPQNRQPIVAWAPSSAQGKTADQQIIVEALTGLAERQITFTFRCYGVDDPREIAPFLSQLADAGISVTTYPKMPYQRFLDSLQEVAVGLAPFSLDSAFNQGKSFGKVLAYLISDVAIVASPVLEHPKFFRHGENGMLPQTPADWVDAVACLLTDPHLRYTITDCAWRDFSRELTTEVASERVAQIIEDILGISQVGKQSPFAE